MYHFCFTFYILSRDVFTEMSNLGLNIEPVELNEFKIALSKAEEDSKKAAILTSMLAYQSEEETLTIPKNNAYTMQVLYRLGFNWSITTWDYVSRFIKMLKGLGFFEI